MITADPIFAAFAVDAGVDRIFIDTEILGKEDRQGHLNTVISHHTIDDVVRVRPVVPAGRLLVRINPLHPGSGAEIDSVIAAGADILMLPMFRRPDEVSAFIQLVRGRAKCCLLMETVGALASFESWVDTPGIDEVHVGLNDLHLEQKLDFMFEPLVNGQIDGLAGALRERHIPFGIGGVARVGEGTLPAELVLTEHARLGSTAAILSRAFVRHAATVQEIRQQTDLPAELSKLRDAYDRCLHMSPDALSLAHQQVREKVQAIAAHIRSSKAGHSA